jgi:hypothetical protein
MVRFLVLAVSFSAITFDMLEDNSHVVDFFNQRAIMLVSFAAVIECAFIEATHRLVFSESDIGCV